MRASARAACLSLVLAFLAGATTPCPPRADAGAPRAAAWTAFHGAHEHGLEADGRQAALVLTAPCPCGCQHLGTTAPGSVRLGYALLRGAERPVTAPGWTHPPVGEAAPPHAPSRAIDPIPI